MTPTFKVGDRVQSAPTSSDITMMGDTWIAEVVTVRTGVQRALDGCCYVTHGRWASKPKARLTARPLWANNLVLISD